MPDAADAISERPLGALFSGAKSGRRAVAALVSELILNGSSLGQDRWLGSYSGTDDLRSLGKYHDWPKIIQQNRFAWACNRLPIGTMRTSPMIRLRLVIDTNRH